MFGFSDMDSFAGFCFSQMEEEEDECTESGNTAQTGTDSRKDKKPEEKETAPVRRYGTGFIGR